MESYMIWQLSLCVGFLLAFMVMFLIAAVVVLNLLMAKDLRRDIEKIITQCEECGEVTSDDREN